MGENKKEQDKLLDHNYDGIQEYDNDLPKWWVNIFWVTIIWGVIYIFYFHFYLDSTEERLNTALAAIEAKKIKSIDSNQPTDEAAILSSLIGNQEVIAKGATTFATKCAACHGMQGQGLVGPNLTDEYWIHGGKLTDIKHTILEGVPAKGMLSWKALMTNEEVNSVIAFIISIKGTTPPNPKAPEGEVYKE